MTFETYAPKSRRQEETPRVSISANGMLNINPAAMEKHFGQTEAIQLLYDRESSRVGIKPVPPNTDNSLKLRRPRRSKSGQISAGGFLTFFKIPHGKSQRYDLEWKPDLNLAVFTVETT